MQPITLKLTFAQSSLLKKSIELALSDVNETEYVINNDLEGLLILANLRPLYIKLTKITAIQYLKTKSIKLEPYESISILRMYQSFVTDVEPGTWIENQIIIICAELHQYALISGEYLKIPSKQGQSANLPPIQHGRLLLHRK